jgi:hypothetical protein
MMISSIFFHMNLIILNRLNEMVKQKRSIFPAKCESAQMKKKTERIQAVF